MKKFLFLIAPAMLMILSGCKSTAPQFYVGSSYVDYSVYAKSGFFITESNSVGFEYEPVGSIYSSALSGWIKSSELVIQKEYDDVYSNVNKPKTKNKEVWKEASIYDALDKAVKDAKEMGGNGLINFNTEAIWEYNQVLKRDIFKGYSVSGMVIKK